MQPIDLTELDLADNETVIQVLPLNSLYILASLGRVFSRGIISLHCEANFFVFDQIAAYLENAYFIDATQEFPIFLERDVFNFLIVECLFVFHQD